MFPLRTQPVAKSALPHSPPLPSSCLPGPTPQVQLGEKQLGQAGVGGRGQALGTFGVAGGQSCTCFLGS